MVGVRDTQVIVSISKDQGTGGGGPEKFNSPESANIDIDFFSFFYVLQNYWFMGMK
jgi:hypothetical protein